jgi:hypothetical protein
VLLLLLPPVSCSKHAVKTLRFSALNAAAAACADATSAPLMLLLLPLLLLPLLLLPPFLRPLLLLLLLPADCLSSSTDSSCWHACTSTSAIFLSVSSSAGSS